MHHQDAFTVAGNPKTLYFLYVMMATGFLVICIRGCCGGALLFFHVVSLSTSSSELRLRRM